MGVDGKKKKQKRHQTGKKGRKKKTIFFLREKRDSALRMKQKTKDLEKKDDNRGRRNCHKGKGEN